MYIPYTLDERQSDRRKTVDSDDTAKIPGLLPLWTDVKTSKITFTAVRCCLYLRFGCELNSHRWNLALSFGVGYIWWSWGSASYWTKQCNSDGNSIYTSLWWGKRTREISNEGATRELRWTYCYRRNRHGIVWGVILPTLATRNRLRTNIGWRKIYGLREGKCHLSRQF